MKRIFGLILSLFIAIVVLFTGSCANAAIPDSSLQPVSSYQENQQYQLPDTHDPNLWYWENGKWYPIGGKQKPVFNDQKKNKPIVQKELPPCKPFQQINNSPAIHEKLTPAIKEIPKDNLPKLHQKLPQVITEPKNNNPVEVPGTPPVIVPDNTNLPQTPVIPPVVKDPKDNNPLLLPGGTPVINDPKDGNLPQIPGTPPVIKNPGGDNPPLFPGKPPVIKHDEGGKNPYGPGNPPFINHPKDGDLTHWPTTPPPKIKYPKFDNPQPMIKHHEHERHPALKRFPNHCWDKKIFINRHHRHTERIIILQPELVYVHRTCYDYQIQHSTNRTQIFTIWDQAYVTLNRLVANGSITQDQMDAIFSSLIVDSDLGQTNLLSNLDDYFDWQLQQVNSQSQVFFIIDKAYIILNGLVENNSITQDQMDQIFCDLISEC